MLDLKYYLVHYSNLIILWMTIFIFFAGILLIKIQNFGILFLFKLSFSCPSKQLLPYIFFFLLLNRFLFFPTKLFFISNLRFLFVITFFIIRFEKLSLRCYQSAQLQLEPFGFYLLKLNFFKVII